MITRKRCPGSIAVSCLLFYTGATGITVAQESATFLVDRTTVMSAGQSVASTSFATTVVTGQMSPSGAASFCNAGYNASFGFFSVLGNLPVPIQLQISKSSVDSSRIKIQWSGSPSAFQLYRSPSPHDVLDPSHLREETPLCDESDILGIEHIVFYKVIAAPGR